MDCSVRFVAEVRETSKGYEQVAGVKPALCVRGKKIALAVINDDTWVRTIELPLPDHDKAGFVHYHGEPYEPKPFADRLLMSAKLARKPMTRRAKHILELLDKTNEEKLPEEILEPVDIEQERIMADNTPKERQKAAQRPSPVRDVTKEYQGKLYAVEPELPIRTEEPRSQVIESVATGAKKAPKKVAKVPAKGKPAKAAKSTPAKPAADRGNLIKKLASEFKVTTQEFRVAVRATGMRAPYEDEKKVRAAYQQGIKVVAKAKAKKK